MPTSSPFPVCRSLAMFAFFGMLLTACQKHEREPTPARGDSGPVAARVADNQAPAALSLKLDNPQAALDFLERSELKLKEAKDDCTLVAEQHGTLGSLVRHSRQRATQKSIRCEATPGASTWSCEAELLRSGGENPEAEEFALKLRYTVDDTTRTIPVESLVCLMAG